MEATTYEEIKAKFTNTGLEIEESIIDSAEALEIFRIKYLGSKSIIKDLAQYIKEVPGDHRKEGADPMRFRRIPGLLQRHDPHVRQVLHRLRAFRDASQIPQGQGHVAGVLDHIAEPAVWR